jgi:hypothetical protein
MPQADSIENGLRKRADSLPKRPLKPYTLLVLLAFLTGFTLRVWDFGNLPPGLSEDEVSISVEADSLYHFGIDRNAESYPIHFISWGSGQNVPYAYLLALLVPLGLTPVVIRLPMLISGLLTLVIVFGIARKLFTPSIALLSLFLLAISPWHIMMSRWALDANLFPFAFSLAFLCLVYTDRHPVWFPVSMVLFALSLYFYGPSYFVVPLLVVTVAAFFLVRKVIPRKNLFIGLALFCFFAIPILLFIIINALQLNEIHLGLITIPRVVGNPRIIEMAGFLRGNGNAWYYYDLLTTGKILFLHDDGIVSNFIPPFGYLFPGAIIFSLIGAFLVAEKFLKEKSYGVWALGGWLVLAFLLAIVEPPVVHRINILFIPLILCAAVTVDWIIRDKRLLAVPITLALAAYTVLFFRDYTSPDYNGSVGWSFNEGLIPAIQSAMKYPDQPVCLTNELSMPYIYVMLADFKDPRVYLANIQYLDPIAKYRIVLQMGRYSFGIRNCNLNLKTIYILKNDQKLPLDDSMFTPSDYGDYVVYIPKSVP